MTLRSAHYDRLVPRYCDADRKRKAASEAEAEAAKKPSQGGGAKKEYSKLRTLVPALSERDDLSKVEIIEETIRYIDALHHQLAARGVNDTDDDPASSVAVAESNPESTLVCYPALLLMSSAAVRLSRLSR